MSIKAKLFGAILFLSASLLASITSGYWSLTQSASISNSIVEDEVVSIAGLKQVADAYAVSIVDTTHKLRAKTLTWKEASTKISEAHGVIEKQWKAYLASPLSPEEIKLVERMKGAIAAAAAPLKELEGIIARQDAPELARFAEAKLYPAIDPISDVVSDLIERQVAAAREKYEISLQTKSLSLALMLGVGIFAALVVSLSLALVVRGIIGPLGGLELTMRRIAEGETDLAIGALSRKDELGKMASAVEVFRLNAIERLRLEAASAEEQAARARRQESLERAIRSFEKNASAVMGTVATASTELQAAAESLTDTAEETLAQTTSVAVAATQAAANVQSVAAAGEELSAATNAILQQVEHSNKLASGAVQWASSSNATVQGLSEAAEQIGRVVALIRSIAGQTNLLALNATIEAARAGEAGRGFAVVASEVKELAAQTSRATDEVSAAIEAIQVSIGDTVGTIETFTATISDINEISTSIGNSMAEQSRATSEIAHSAQQVASGTDEVSCAIDHVRSAATTSGAAAEQVLGAASELARQSETLREEMDSFLAQVRAA